MSRIKTFFSGLFRILLQLLLAVSLMAAGWWSGQTGFDSLREMRQLERTPRSMVAAMLPGEVNAEGRVVRHEQLLRSPETNTETVYYRHHVEREERDSEGNTRWRTISDKRRQVSFLLDDGSGQALVLPSGAVDFRAPQRYQQRRGDMRYTEYRIEPGDSVFVFAWAESRNQRMALVFDTPGQYSPIISTAGEASARSRMAGMALIWVWVGLVAASFAVLALCWAVRIHLTAFYLLLLAMVLVGGQSWLAVRMASTDLISSHERLTRDLDSAAQRIQNTLAGHGLFWSGEWDELEQFDDDHYAALPASERQALAHLVDRMALQSERTAAIARQFPERWLASSLDLPTLPDIANGGLPDTERQLVTRIHMLIGTLVMLLGLGLSVLFSVLGFRRIRLKRLIEDLPTSPSAGVAYGLAELSGVVRPEPENGPLKAPLTDSDCVWFRYKEEERRGSGRNARWVTIAEETSRQRFLLEDREGAMPVDPPEAEVITRKVTTRRKGARRFREWLFAPGTKVYALGSAEVDPSTESSLRLCRGEQDNPFILSDYSEAALTLRKARRGFVFLNLSLNAGSAMGLAMIGTIGALHGAGFLASALVPLLYTGLFLAILMYNGLVSARQRVRRAWANIAVSLTKRAELVPMLENVLKAYLKHEQELQARLARLRTLASQVDADTGSAGEMVREEQWLLRRLGALREQYPDLKANQLSGDLMRRLIVLENEVALMRAGYNDSVERYNTRRLHFPELLFTRAFDFDEATLFNAEMHVRKVPGVSNV